MFNSQQLIDLPRLETVMCISAVLWFKTKQPTECEARPISISSPSGMEASSNSSLKQPHNKRTRFESGTRCNVFEWGAAPYPFHLLTLLLLLTSIWRMACLFSPCFVSFFASWRSASQMTQSCCTSYRLELNCQRRHYSNSCPYHNQANSQTQPSHQHLGTCHWWAVPFTLLFPVWSSSVAAAGEVTPNPIQPALTIYFDQGEYTHISIYWRESLVQQEAKTCWNLADPDSFKRIPAETNLQNHKDPETNQRKKPLA